MRWPAGISRVKNFMDYFGSRYFPLCSIYFVYGLNVYSVLLGVFGMSNCDFRNIERAGVCGVCVVMRGDLQVV